MKTTPSRSRSALALAFLAAGACAPRERTAEPAPEALAHTVIPAPANVELQSADSFRLTEAAVIVVETPDPGGERVARWFARLVGNTVESTPLVLMPGETVPADTVRRARIELALGDDDAAGAEGYTLDVSPQRVRITAAAPAGLFYGLQTLRQLLPPQVEYTAALPRPLSVPAVRIVDAPRFEWRGAMLDVSRHFLGVEDVKRYIDRMVLYKLNRLHLHLADDQGWRIEIPAWPRLAEVGGRGAVGGHPGGYYTREQYADLVAYAAERFVTIVPEIDMPGHTNAALASYAELNCNGVAPPLYTGIEVGFSALCVEKDVTYRFIDDVVGTIAALTTGPYFHVGGDEVEKLTHEQYRAFIERVEGIVRKHGKRMIGWGEIAPANLSASAIVQHWRADSARLAVARGSRVILSPAEKIYLDMKYDSTTVLGLNWAGYNDLRDAYEWEPGLRIEGVPESAILGLEAPLWSETLGTIDDFEYMAFPRLVAVAELGWSLPARRGWDGFLARLRAHDPRWSALGINYNRRALP